MIEHPSPNHDSRDGVAVDMLVLHYTGMKSAEAALERLCDPSARVSAHYAIDEEGKVYRLVPESERAWHAGVSFWAGARNINARSIGIELVNPGHEFGYRPFPEAQIRALIPLCQEILARHAIPPSRILGHSDVAPARKTDPGELFPWARLAESGIGVWPKPAQDPGEGAVAHLLTRYGYEPEVPGKERIAAFQRHFRPARVDGIADLETRQLLAGLGAFYDPEKKDRA